MSIWRVETPESVFADWAYRIEPYHYPALGMAKREYSVREIPEPGKKPLKNVVEAEIIARDLGRTHYQSWSHGIPFVTDFCAGDIFYLRTDPNRYLQVRVVASVDAIEIGTGTLGSGPPEITTLTDQQLVARLRTG